MWNGGQLLVECLVALGATKAFGVPDESYLAVLDALLVLHAEAAPVPRDAVTDFIGTRADAAIETWKQRKDTQS